VIYADQFEELFTYPENFRHGKCSAEAQLLVNLLLETARISLEQNLPVYVVCTMRSDYIGQCSSFRGLAEYIGFSHYFVPRLNRLELRQVIEEPAMLNGDEISPRLVERLLYDLEEGNDQLPVLQHALSRIWQLAAEKGEPMDLIHYAMAGGMKAEELPEENQAEFRNWLAAQPQELQAVFSRPGLDNVLNLHAEGLLLEAVEICRKKNLHGNDSSAVPEAIFRCLTQVDRGRVVRNQVSAEELLQILEIPGLQLEELDAVSGVFRKPGNTFLRPFISEEATSLKADSVLDITHESLIRNWDKLAAWTDAEEKDKQTFRDFERQLQRWQESGKSSDYLLPIGPLNQFEGWFEKKMPNAGWLAGLNEEDENRDAKLKKAAQLLETASEFIRKSARRLLLTRTVMKYGANRILLLAGCVVVALSCLYYYLEYRYKQNDAVIERVLAEGKELMANPNVSMEQKARFAILWERHHGENSFIPLLDSLQNDTMAFDLGLEMFKSIHFLLDQRIAFGFSKKDFQKLSDKKSLHSLCFRLLPFLEKKVKDSPLVLKNNPNRAKRMSQLLMLYHLMDFSTGQSKYMKKALEINQELLDNFILATVNDSNQKNTNPEIFYKVFVQCLFISQDKTKLGILYEKLKGTDNSEAFRRLFPADQILELLKNGYEKSKVPYQAGKLILQFLAQRNRDDAMVKILYLENHRFFSLLGGGADEESIRKFNAYLFRNSFSFALLEGDGKRFLSTFLPLHQAVSLEKNPLRFPDLIAGFRKKPLLPLEIDFLFHNTSGAFLRKTHHNQAMQLLSEKFLETERDELELAEYHKARCFWFDSYGDSVRAEKEALISLASIKNVHHSGLEGSDNFNRKKLFLEIFKPKTEYSFLKTKRFATDNYQEGYFPSWEKSLFLKSTIATFAGLPAFREFVYKFLNTGLSDDSSLFNAQKKNLQKVLELCRSEKAFFDSDTFQVYSCLLDLRINEKLDIQFINLEKSSRSAFIKKIQFLTKQMTSQSDPDLYSLLSLWLVRRGYIVESLNLLNKLPSGDKQRAVANIVQYMNETGTHAEFMPAVLDKAFAAGGSARQKYFPGQIYAALSSTGSSRFIQFAYNLLKEADEFSKSNYMYDMIDGLCIVKMLHQAEEIIPPQSSSSYRLMLLNRLLQEDEKAALQTVEWKDLKFRFSYLWNEE
jgi:hypothetical protein